MNNERSFKTEFKRSVRYQKGFAISLAAPTLPGTPDLFVVMPGYMPILLEAKWLGDIKQDNFKRKLKFTPMQIEYMVGCNRVGERTALGLIGFKWAGDIWAVVVRPTTLRLESDQITNHPYTLWQKRELDNKLHFDVDHLFKKSGIYRRNGLTSPIKYASPSTAYEYEGQIDVRAVDLTNRSEGSTT